MGGGRRAWEECPTCGPVLHRGFLLLLIFFLLAPLSAMAQTATLSGTITDAATGETLIGATVVDTRSGKGTVTNLYGHYSLTIPRDSVSLKVSFVGYEPQHFNLRLDANRELNVKLASSLTLNEVVITAERVGDVRSVQMSANVMTVEKIKSVPVMFGEADLIKALQLMPGVQSGSEGNSGMYVRGGGPDENLFLLDGVPLYNVSHMGGFFSAFNTDAVKNVTLYKGSFPARFGGRLSAVLDVTQNNGNDQELHGNLSVGLISAKFNLEGPLVKGKTTFSLSARRTYAELFVIPAIMWLNDATSDDEPDGPAVVENSKFDAGYYFYDINAKLTHKFSDKSRLYASFYMGDDKIHGKVHTVTALDEDINLGFSTLWGNLVGSLRWNYELTPKLFLNLSASYTQYKNNIEGSVEKLATPDDPNASTITGNYDSGIKEATLRADFDYAPNPDNNVKFGLSLSRHWFTPEVANASVNYYDSIQMNRALEIDSSIVSGIVPASEMVAYFEDDWSVTDVFKLNYGLHYSSFYVKDHFYHSVQPRFSGRLLITPDLSFKVGYAQMTQYVHLLSTTSVTLPTDLWVPVTDRIEPMTSEQVAAGLSYSLSGIADFSVEAYYKHMDNLIEYKDGATFFGSTENWENLVYSGRGWSYGVEFLIQREYGDLTGWVGYTWSRSMHQFDRDGQMINDGKPFPAKYDRRHDLSIVLSYKLSPSVDVSATWVFSTGNAASLSMQSYPSALEDPDDYDNDQTGGRNTISVVEGRNNYRLPNYHRLDLGANFHRKFKHARRTISVSVYNVYNRQNPYMLYRSRTHTYQGYPSALVQLSIFPILPSVGYTLFF
ncbi:MAG: carboxypeptidase-like regulatory domain-containing protein [Bacteroidales bacterium]|nr:carboxypeptidase-like regulatory domain-containing protein [Bacteroidales bacterium]